MLIKVQMECKYEKNHDNGTETNGSPEHWPRTQSPWPSSQFGPWIWTHQAPTEPQAPYLLSERVELNYL